MKKLPKTIFVSIRDAGTDGEHLHTTTDISEFDDGEVVCEYQKVSTNRKRVVHELDQKS